MMQSIQKNQLPTNSSEKSPSIWVNSPTIKSSYFVIYRVPAGQTVYVEAAENDRLKIGVVYYISDDFERLQQWNGFWLPNLAFLYYVLAKVTVVVPTCDMVQW